jgi:hypothetical protein
MPDRIVLAFAIHIGLALCIGLLALKWKGRSFVMWTLIGMGGSLLGLVLLSFFPSMKTVQQPA